MADHSEPTPRHSAHERFDNLPPSSIPALAATNRDTAVIVLAGATAIFLSVAIALSIMLWRGSGGDTLANASRSGTPEASAAAQPVAPGPAEEAASAAQEPAESAHAEEATAEASAEASAEATHAASAEATHAATAEATAHAEDPEAEDPDAVAALQHRSELPVTGTAIPLLAVPLTAATGTGLALAGLLLMRVARRRVAAAAAENIQISAVEALWQFLEETRRRPEDGPRAHHGSPADQTARLQRVAEQASRRR